MGVFDTTDLCEYGAHEIGTDRRHGYIRRCKKCGTPAQDLVDGRRRIAIKGDYRVVCREDTCPIGPSEATPHRTTAIEWYNDHQREAVELSGEAHDVEVVQF